MSRRIKMTLPDTLVAHLEAIAEERGEPPSRIAAQLVCAEIKKRSAEQTGQAVVPFVGPAMDPDLDRRAPWIEPFYDQQRWRTQTWGSIVALYGRYPRALQHLKDGWWEDASHVDAVRARRLAGLDRPGG